jgi:hypothetical protein
MLGLPNFSSNCCISPHSSSGCIIKILFHLLELSASQFESRCSPQVLEKQISIYEQFHSMQYKLSICEAHNLHLDHKLTCLTHAHFHESDFSLLQAKNLHLCQLDQSQWPRIKNEPTSFAVLQLPFLSRFVRLLFPHKLGCSAKHVDNQASLT